VGIRGGAEGGEAMRDGIYLERNWLLLYGTRRATICQRSIIKALTPCGVRA
jgi:hypothetical protein